MASDTPSASRQAGGLIALIEQSHAGQCETPNRPYLGRLDESKKKAYFIQPDCKLWSCDHCGAKRARHWAYVIDFGGDDLRKAGGSLSMVTLTSHRRVRTVVGGITVWRSAWPRIAQRMRRVQPGVQFAYTAEHRGGRHFHVHLATTAEMNTRWYKTASAETGMGYQSKARRISPDEHLGWYFSKYLTKSLDVDGWPRHWRRVNKSRKWPTPPAYESPFVWRYIGKTKSELELAISSSVRAGYSISHGINSPDASQL